MKMMCCFHFALADVADRRGRDAPAQAQPKGTTDRIVALRSPTQPTWPTRHTPPFGARTSAAPNRRRRRLVARGS